MSPIDNLLHRLEKLKQSARTNGYLRTRMEDRA